MNVDHKCTFQHTATRRWLLTHIYSASGRQNGFNTQPPEGGCIDVSGFSEQILVSTHSRTKAAATLDLSLEIQLTVSTHSRTKAAARHCCYIARYFLVSTHSRAKAAASDNRENVQD